MYKVSILSSVFSSSAESKESIIFSSPCIGKERIAKRKKRKLLSSRGQTHM